MWICRFRYFRLHRFGVVSRIILPSCRRRYAHHFGVEFDFKMEIVLADRFERHFGIVLASFLTSFCVSFWVSCWRRFGLILPSFWRRFSNITRAMDLSKDFFYNVIRALGA